MLLRTDSLIAADPCHLYSTYFGYWISENNESSIFCSASETFSLNRRPEVLATFKQESYIAFRVTFLAIERKNTLLSLPDADEQVQLGDQLLCYGEVGKIPSIKE